MKPALINGEVWRVVRVTPSDPRLIDREGKRTIGTTDPVSRTIHLSSELVPPMLDKVLLHEVAHAITMAYGKLDWLGRMVDASDRIGVEEWSAQMMENHAIESASIASEVLGRPLCVRGFCID